MNKLEFPYPELLPANTRLKPLSGGHINGTWLLSAGGGPYAVLQRINPVVFRRPLEVTDNYLTIYRHLEKQVDLGLRLPAPIPFSNGQFAYSDESGAAWRMTTFLDNTYATEHADRAETAYEAALAAGRFLAGLEGLSPESVAPVIPGFHDSVKRWERFLEVERLATPEKLAAAAPEIRFLYASHQLFDEIRALHLPQRVVHNDAKLANILFDGATGKACAVIDWDTVMPGSALADFGDLVRSLAAEAPEDAVNPERIAIKPDFFDALCRGFLKGAGEVLSRAEMDNLLQGAFWLTLEQALRFLTDYLENNVYYPVQYPDHNLVRTRSQLALFRQLKEQEDRLHAILSARLPVNNRARL